MNTEPQDPQRLRALELALQARRETLPEEDQRFLDGYLAAHPDAAAEVRDMDALLGRLRTAPPSVRPEFEQKLRSAVAGWVREDALARPRTAAAVSPFRSVSGSTLFLGRSLAFYLGAASVICAFLLLRDPAPEAEVRTNDRAHTFTDEKPPVKQPGLRPDLRPRPK